VPRDRFRLEGEETFTGLQRFLATVRRPTGKRRISRFVYPGRKPGEGPTFPHHHRRRIMHRMTWAMGWLIIGTGLVPALADTAGEARKKLQGAWIATKAERDGKAADDDVGNRLSFTGDRFQIRSKDGKPLYGGTVRLDPSTNPSAIDVEHTEGP
jgi:hypothetical protein